MACAAEKIIKSMYKWKGMMDRRGNKTLRKLTQAMLIIIHTI
jgi:hypothetical protein